MQSFAIILVILSANQHKPYPHTTMTFWQDPVNYAVPFFVLLIAIELYLSQREKRNLYEWHDSWASIGMGIGVVFIGLVMKAIALAFYTWLYQYRLFTLPWNALTGLAILFADDFTFYWHHRISHEVRFFWAAHINHHSSQYYNLATALRQSWGEDVYKFIWWAWLPLVGFDPIMIMIMQSISLIYQFWIHTQIIDKMGVLEYFMNTPSHHRVHHGSNVRYLDRNHAGILIIWDKIFGTFEPENPKEPVVYGITTNIETYNLLKIATHEYQALWNDVKNAATWRDRFNYLFKAPGWTPTDDSMTSRSRQRALKQPHNAD
jgi:sterol desaturase/sphingolipid hydroxylase (fatty acid hydroxylase superfamily)